MKAEEYAVHAARLRALVQELESARDDTRTNDIYVAISYLRLAAAKLEQAAKIVKGATA